VSAGLDPEVLAAAPDAVRRRALRAAAVAAGSPAGSLGRRHVLAMDALVTRWRGQGEARLPGRVSVRRACGRLLVERAGPPATPAGTPPEAQVETRE
jgi:tRNA(Ile)-lysidine synthase